MCRVPEPCSPHAPKLKWSHHKHLSMLGVYSPCFIAAGEAGPQNQLRSSKYLQLGADVVKALFEVTALSANCLCDTVNECQGFGL